MRGKRRARQRPYPYFAKSKYGTYYAHYLDRHGNRCRHSLKTKVRDEASAKFEKLVEELSRGVISFKVAKSFSLQEAAARYLEDGTFDLRPRSLERYEECLRLHVLPYFKRTPFRSITPKKVRAFVRKRQQDGAAPSTIYKDLAALSAVFNFACEEEWIDYNPVKAIRKPKLRQVRPIYVPTKAELELILDNLFPGARRFFLAFCYTGCRLTEISSLDLRDVDFLRNRIRVVRKGGKIDFIPMGVSLRLVIEAELEERGLDLRRDRNEPLFMNRERRRYRCIKNPLGHACRLAGVPHCSHHSLRHAYATILHEGGERVATISRLLGHSSPTTTRNIYVHWSERDVVEAADSIQLGKN